MPIDLGFHFQNCQHFLEYFGLVLPIDCSPYEKTVIGIFVYFFISKLTTAKVNFHFYTQCSQEATRLICERAIFSVKCWWYRFLALIFLYTLKKILKILEMELKTYTLVGPKFVVEKIKYTNLEIQFRPLKYTVVTRIRKNFEQPFIPIQAIQGSYSVLT